jgi:hypothetical protein
MQNEIQADWRDLCFHASTETDPVKLISLVEKILQTFADLDDSRPVQCGDSRAPHADAALNDKGMLA